MNNFKKLLSMMLVIGMMLSMATVFAGCGNNEVAQTTDAAAGGNVTYTVSVESAGGMALSGIDVYLYADNTLSDLKQYGETDENGNVSFTIPESADYAIQLAGVPDGYQLDAYYSFNGTAASIKLTSSLISGESLSGATLGLGDVMYDFSVTTPAGETVTLSEMLAEKDMVLLNFWYTTCTYCVAEFPYMEEAYQQYIDDVGIIAVNPFEDDNAVASFQSQMGLTFTMAACQPAWATAFNVSGYPTSIIIDRYGVICLIEAGGITNLRPFLCMYEHFTADDYQQQLFTSLDELVTDIKPTYTMPTSEEITAVISPDAAGISYRAEEGDDAEMSWPFIIDEKNGEACIKASNQEIDGSFATLYMDVTLKAGQAVAFDYLASTETAADILYVVVNDEAICSIYGVDENETWKTCYPWVAQEDGTYEVALCYLKDESTNAGDDTVYLKNVRIVEESEVDTATYLPRYPYSTADGFEYEYAAIVLNEADGYYHVGSEDGPLLLADMMGYTEFNEEKTVYEIAYAGDVTIDGYNYYEDIVDYCSYASNSNLYGMCTVNEELAELLEKVAQVAGFEGSENEWLKICKYYASYGTDAELEDPIKGLATFSAYEAKLGKNIETNVFTYNRIIIPRGLLAKFVPATSGVYRITSRNESQDGVEGWIFGEGREELYVYEMSERMYNDDKNVSMLYYMEAGKPYYIDIAFWDTYQTGSIYYDIEYVGATYNLFRLASPGYFTYDSDATGDTMYYTIAGGIDVVLGEDGKYYEDKGLDANGNQKYGSLLYCDFTGITGLFGSPIATVDGNGRVVDADSESVVAKGMIDLGGFDFSKTEDDLYILAYLEARDYDVEATDEYLKALWGEDYESYAEIYQIEDVYEGIYHGKGEDLTEQISAYLDDIITTGSAERIGCVPVTAELADILQKLMDKYTFEGVDHSWTKLCYYYQYLGPEG